MARESVKILQGKLDVESLIAQLNAALAEEWLAYYQYWVGALVVEGAMRADVQGEFEEHAEEEPDMRNCSLTVSLSWKEFRCSTLSNGLSWQDANMMLRRGSTLSVC